MVRSVFRWKEIILAIILYSNIRKMSTLTTQQDDLDQFCKIYLRRDQTGRDIGSHRDPKVAIYAPSWVKDGLQTLAGQLSGKRFKVLEAYSSSPLEEFTLTSTLTLTELQKISRNEASNVDGVINIGHYSDGGIDDLELLLAMKGKYARSKKTCHMSQT